MFFEFTFWILQSSKSPPKFTKLVKIVLTLNHGHAAVERGFNINEGLLVENLQETFVIALRQINLMQILNLQKNLLTCEEWDLNWIIFGDENSTFFFRFFSIKIIGSRNTFRNIIRRFFVQPYESFCNRKCQGYHILVFFKALKTSKILSVFLLKFWRFRLRRCENIEILLHILQNAGGSACGALNASKSCLFDSIL